MRHDELVPFSFYYTAPHKMILSGLAHSLPRHLSEVEEKGVSIDEIERVETLILVVIIVRTSMHD